jgi:arylsulfatase A-like enzyme
MTSITVHKLKPLKSVVALIGTSIGKIRAILVLCAALCASVANAQSTDPVRTGLWWNSSESGWGLNLTHQGTTIFATLFTYQNANSSNLNKSAWFVMSNGQRQTNGSFTGELYRTTGTPVTVNPFVALTAANVTQVGTMTLTFTSSEQGTLTYTVNGVSVTKTITKQVFGTAAAVCSFTTNINRSTATNYQDLWWNPNESGWGINLTHQDDIVFATLFVYDSASTNTWYVMSGGRKQADGSFLGELYQVVGPAFIATPFAPLDASNSAQRVRQVGTLRLTFQDGQTGSLVYSVDGTTITKSVTRQVFSTPVSNCSPVLTKPNILLIIADDQGLDSSNQYSYSLDRPRTPTLDTLASSGIVFDNLWATPSCTTTRGTLITGQHGVHSGISFVPAVMNTSTNTIQRYLKASTASANYQTAVIGKWHLGGANPANSHPTDSGVGYYAGNITGVLPNFYSWPLIQNGVTSTSNVYHTTKITDLARDWISAQSLSPSQPWFLWLAYSAPHDPFHLPPSTLHSRSTLTGTTADIAAKTREYYLAAIEAMDSEIGRLLSSMSAETRANTLIVFIGDNGTPTQTLDANVYTRTKVKGTLYEGGVRVPMVVSGKGVSRSNVRESALINTVDFYATIANLAGNSVTQLNDGFSFASLLQAGGAAARQYNYSEFQSDTVSGWIVRNGQYKLIQNLSGTQELYDVSRDLKEQTNLLLSGTDYSAIVNTLKLQGETIRK